MSAEDQDVTMSAQELLDELEWWRDIIVLNSGDISQTHVLQELHDYRNIMENASKVYYHITCGRMSKPNYFADDVIAVSDQCANAQIQDIVLDVLDRIDEGESIIDLREEFRIND